MHLARRKTQSCAIFCLVTTSSAVFPQNVLSIKPSLSRDRLDSGPPCSPIRLELQGVMPALVAAQRCLVCRGSLAGPLPRLGLFKVIFTSPELSPCSPPFWKEASTHVLDAQVAACSRQPSAD